MHFVSSPLAFFGSCQVRGTGLWPSPKGSKLSVVQARWECAAVSAAGERPLVSAGFMSRALPVLERAGRSHRCRAASDYLRSPERPAVPALNDALCVLPTDPVEIASTIPESQAAEIDPFYLFACHVDWELREDPSAAWELIAAAQSAQSDTRAHALALLGRSKHLGGAEAVASRANSRRDAHGVADMNTPYGLNIIEDCTACHARRFDFFCGFSHSVLASLNHVSHKSTLPAGAILFVEGQTPRGMFVLCSGRVNLSTTSREGKVLILKTAEAGEALGLSAAISGAGYEVTAETATPCQLNFVDRRQLLELMRDSSEPEPRFSFRLPRYSRPGPDPFVRGQIGEASFVAIAASRYGCQLDSRPVLHDSRRDGAAHRFIPRDRNPAAQ